MFIVPRHTINKWSGSNFKIWHFCHKYNLKEIFKMFDYFYLFDKAFNLPNETGLYDAHKATKDGKDTMELIYNAVGIDPDDLSVTVERENGASFIMIKGETTVGERTYSAKSRFKINESKIKSIEYECKDGLLYINATLKEEGQPKIPVIKLDKK